MTRRDEQRRAQVERWFAEALACTDVDRAEMYVGLALEGRGGKLRSGAGALVWLRREVRLTRRWLRRWKGEGESQDFHRAQNAERGRMMAALLRI